jgi:FkbM family methyltransferase
MNFLQRFLRPGDTATDVGANIDVYSLLAASVEDPGVAFEPNPFNVERLRQRVLRNEFSQVHIIEAAVAECDSELS